MFVERHSVPGLAEQQLVGQQDQRVRMVAHDCRGVSASALAVRQRRSLIMRQLQNQYTCSIFLLFVQGIGYHSLIGERGRNGSEGKGCRRIHT